MSDNNEMFNIGDIVYLRSDKYMSNSTLMTVNDIEMGKVTCVWSGKDFTFNERTFSADALELYDKKE